jgi:hypothetical protein
MYVWVQVDGVALDEIVVGDGQHARKNNLPGQGALLKPIYVCMYVICMYVCVRMASINGFPVGQAQTACSGGPAMARE